MRLRYRRDTRSRAFGIVGIAIEHRDGSDDGAIRSLFRERIPIGARIRRPFPFSIFPQRVIS